MRPAPPPLTINQLRQMWRESTPGSPERRILLEIARLHHVLQEVSGLSRSIERAFYEETGMRMMALQSLKNLLMDEPAIINMRR